MDNSHLAEDDEETFHCGLNPDLHAVANLRAAISYWESRQNDAGRVRFDDIFKPDEEQADRRTAKLEWIEKMGVMDFMQPAK